MKELDLLIFFARYFFPFIFHFFFFFFWFGESFAGLVLVPQHKFCRLAFLTASY